MPQQAVEKTSPPRRARRASESSDLVDAVTSRLDDNQRVRRNLGGSGRLHVDRQLPFLCVYRKPVDGGDAGTMRLVTGEAAYLVGSGAPEFEEEVLSLVRVVAQAQSRHFGSFLILEVWASPEGGKANDPAVPGVLPTFTIHAPAAQSITPAIDALERSLKKTKVLKQEVMVQVVRDSAPHPPGTSPLVDPEFAREHSVSVVGLAVPPIFRMESSGKEFPLLLRALRRSLGLAFRRTFFEFADSCTTQQPPHFHSLGRKATVKVVWKVDRDLAAVSSRFDYLLQLTPINRAEIWTHFSRGALEKVPAFFYRPLPIDPDLLKRDLFAIPVERVEDPALQNLFHDKRAELELKLTMLRDRDTPRFLHESQQLFGGVDDNLVQLARDILAKFPPRERKQAPPDKADFVGAVEFGKRAEAEFEAYRAVNPDFSSGVRIGSDVSGLMVSRGKLLINSDLRLAPTRVDALLAHEVGTHVVTYFNGMQQPLQLLRAGLPGYEELQEGLAVMSEYLVEGLGRGRMRTLAGRVVAVRSLTDGATFVDTYRMLVNEFGFAKKPAYRLALRVYRGGGLTKDAVYLRGLRNLLRYLRRGGDVSPLWVGKIAAPHVPLIRELELRGVIKPAALLPRHMQDPAAAARFEALQKSDVTVTDLVTDLTAEDRRSS